MASSGQPFNITLGQDLNGDSIFNDRAGIALEHDLPAVNRHWQYGLQSVGYVQHGGEPALHPGGADQLRNRPGSGLGEPASEQDLRIRPGDGRPFRWRGRRRGVPGGGGGGRGGGPPGGGLGPGGLSGGGGGGRNPFAGGSTSRRYNLTFSISATNLLNHQNLGAPVGDVNSSRFGESISLAGGFFGTAAANRRVDLQARFSF